MGCGWQANPPANMQLINAVEAINGTASDGPTSGIPFWQEQLNAGHRLTGIGGSDNHNAQAPLPGPGSIGYPSTVVYARELSVTAILDGIRDGHVFIDVTGSKDRVLEMNASADAAHAAMGDALRLASGATAEFTLHITHTNGGRVEVIQDGERSSVLRDGGISQDDQSFTFAWKSDGGRHWIRANVRGSDGRLCLVGNPIYINFDETPTTR
jgi:hypothetical protein